MNNIKKIAKTIQKKLKETESTKPTVSIVYDSIIEIYPKLNKQDKSIYECYRKIIVKVISQYYNNIDITEIDTIKLILSKMIKECEKI